MRIAIIGTRGLPPRYGGFETLASELSHELSLRGHNVIVYGRSGFRQPKHVEMEPGVIAHRLPTIRIEALESLSAGFFGALHSLHIFKPDVVLLCNPGNVWVGKLLDKRGIPVILHMAGLEFKREKWRGLASKVLWWAVQSAVKSNLQLLTDSNAIATWYQDTFSREIDVIEYGAKPVEPNPEVLNQFGLVKNEYDVVIARFEPDTQIVTIINTHARASTNKLVLIGEARDSATMSAYTEEIERAVQSHPNILVLGPIWDEITVDSLWSFSRTYIHGHRTGGTNPALVRAAASGTEVLAFQSPFNIEVLGDNGWYWDSPQDLEELLRKQPWVTSAKSEELRLSTLRRYQWSRIADAYEELMKSVCSGQSR